MKKFLFLILTMLFAVSSVDAQKQIRNLVAFGEGNTSCEACQVIIQEPTVGLQSPDGMFISFSANSGAGGLDVGCTRLSTHYEYGDGTTGTSNNHNYSTPGIYKVCKVVVVQYGNLAPCTKRECSYICVGPNCKNTAGKTVLNDGKTDVSIYPNPAKDIINIELENKVSNGNVSIMNAVGMVLKSAAIVGSNMMLDISELPTGMYFLRTEDSEGDLVLKKFIKE